MKALKIAESNFGAIEAALAAANGLAVMHAFTTAAEIAAIADEGEERLADLGIAKARRLGATVTARSGARVGKAYKYPRQATRVVLERRSAGWYLVGAEAVLLYADQGGSVALTLTEAQDAEAVADLRKNYSVSGIA